MDQREEQLRQRAYSIWQAEGEPHGRDREHWDMAERELSEVPPEASAEVPAEPSVETDVAAGEVATKPATAARKAASPKTTQAAPPTIQDDGSTIKSKARKPRTSKA